MRLIYLLSIIFSSCASNTGTGIITGTVLGGTIGVGAHEKKGGLIGSAAGILAGGLIGASLDLRDRKVIKKSNPRTLNRIDRQEPLTINDIIVLSQKGVSEETILSLIKERKAKYHLTQAQIRRMRDANVDPRVIDFMIQCQAS